ncbi:hypothetical protein JIN85_08840 [Luteolibacter pohnpeiensis]|uniref:Uncharacterized protein n=1 Tax=Luteolibacter pohnpeiensis TaxID=454153 RepID=A0A934S3J5_9BACT|nr:hypothetical protein [Luteolibacter pohnpeiensis]MBK1882520.1 hypothetical protein [Luteolibacter pohnpeiensis]
MDREQAKFILRSFRPDGADVADEDFVEALQFANEDRELGDWFAKERAFDSMFAEAMTQIQIPDSLRQEVLSGLAMHPGDLPHPEDHFDSGMIGSFAFVQPPRSLRSEILASMERTNAAVTPKKSFWQRATLPFAAAAGIALAFLLTSPSKPGIIVAETTVPVEVVQSSFIHTFESPQFSIEDPPEQASQLIAHLQDMKLPSPHHFPKGLQEINRASCRELEINGKRGSLVCFRRLDGSKVHLVIFRRKDVCGELPGRDHPEISQQGTWAVARWLDEKQVYVLIGSTSVEHLKELF